MVRKAFAIVATVFAAALVSVPVAIAAAVPLGAGETKLVLPAGLEKTLRREGVVVKPLGPAKLKGRRLALPVSSGTFDPAAVRASVSAWVASSTKPFTVEEALGAPEVVVSFTY